MTEMERFEQLVALANKWLEDAESIGVYAYIPNNEGQDTVARQRTKGCARELLRILAGGKHEN